MIDSWPKNPRDVALPANDPTNNATVAWLALNNNVIERGTRGL
jgi:hypothetical protein